MENFNLARTESRRYQNYVDNCDASANLNAKSQCCVNQLILHFEAIFKIKISFHEYQDIQMTSDRKTNYF